MQRRADIFCPYLRRPFHSQEPRFKIRAPGSQVEARILSGCVVLASQWRGVLDVRRCGTAGGGTRSVLDIRKASQLACLASPPGLVHGSLWNVLFLKVPGLWTPENHLNQPWPCLSELCQPSGDAKQAGSTTYSCDILSPDPSAICKHISMASPSVFIFRPKKRIDSFKSMK
jgi:hypothetical protein